MPGHVHPQARGAQAREAQAREARAREARAREAAEGLLSFKWSHMPASCVCVQGHRCERQSHTAVRLLAGGRMTGNVFMPCGEFLKSGTDHKNKDGFIYHVKLKCVYLPKMPL